MGKEVERAFSKKARFFVWMLRKEVRMSSREMIWRFCNLREQEASFMALSGSKVGEERIGDYVLECLDIGPECYPLHCKFANGTEDPFILQ